MCASKNCVFGIARSSRGFANHVSFFAHTNPHIAFWEWRVALDPRLWPMVQELIWMAQMLLSLLVYLPRPHVHIETIDYISLELRFSKKPAWKNNFFNRGRLPPIRDGSREHETVNFHNLGLL